MTGIAKSRYGRKTNPNVSKEDFLSLSEYISQARAAIGYFVYPRSHALTLLNSEDAISYVADAMMKSDATYVEGNNTTRSTFRMCGAKFGIRAYMQSCGMRQNYKHDSIQFTRESWGAQDERTDVESHRRCDNPHEHIEQKELKIQLDKILKESPLNNNQRDAVKAYYLNNERKVDISRRLKITHTAIAQAIRVALERMRVHPDIERLMDEYS